MGGLRGSEVGFLCHLWLKSEVPPSDTPKSTGGRQVLNPWRLDGGLPAPCSSWEDFGSGWTWCSPFVSVTVVAPCHPDAIRLFWGEKTDPWPLGGEKLFFPKFLRLVVDMPVGRPEAEKCHGPHGGAVGTCAATPTDTCTSHPMLWGSDTLRGHNPTGH